MVNINQVDFESIDEEHFINVKDASKLWIGKASLGMDSKNKDIASTLKMVFEKLKSSIEQFKPNGNFTDVIKNLNEIKSTLKDLENMDWDGASYKRCIYYGGDGSSYESGVYRRANVDDAIEAIDELINIAREESYIL